MTKRAWPSLLAIVLATAFCALFVALAGQNPLSAGAALVQGATGSRERWAESLAKTIPLIFTGLSVAIAFRGGFFNVGAEGQFLLGALSATAVATRTDFGWPVVLLAGALGGGLWALVAGILKTRRGAPEIITTIMLNYIALRVVEFAVQGPLQERAKSQPQSDLFPMRAQLPALMADTNLHAGLFLAIFCAAMLWFFLNRSERGFLIRAVGANALAARAMGVKAESQTLFAVALCGALAGIGGACEIAGATKQLGIGGFGYGYTAIAVALLAGLNPLRVLVVSLLFGMLNAGGGAMERSANVPTATVNIVIGVLVFVVAVWPRLQGKNVG